MSNPFLQKPNDDWLDWVPGGKERNKRFKPELPVRNDAGPPYSSDALLTVEEEEEQRLWEQQQRRKQEG